MKAFWQSRTIVFNVLVVVGFRILSHFRPEWGMDICGNPEMTLSILALMNILLRLITKTPIGGVLVLCVLLTGCGSMPPQRLDPKLQYRNDLPFCVEGYGCFEGAAVLPRQQSYKFELSPKGEAKVDFFVATTCNRNRSFEPGDSGFSWGPLSWFGRKREGLRYIYVPLEDREDDGDCNLVLHTYEKEKGRHAWAFIRFSHPQYELPATLYCDGEKIQFGGVSVCQAKSGLKQWAEFPEPVMIMAGKPEHGGECAAPHKDETGSYVFAVTKEECGYLIQGQSGQRHHMVTIGYEGELIREVK